MNILACPSSNVIRLPFLLVFFMATTFCFSQINVVADRATAVYQVGEQINFNVLADYTGQVNYTIKLDRRSQLIEEGSIQVIAGQTVQIPYCHEEPGFIICDVNGAIHTKAAAAISPFELQAIEEEPADFDQFWSEQLNQLNSVSLNPNISLYKSTGNSDTYRMQLSNIEGRSVFGYITVPKGAGPFPAFVTLPSFGSGGGHVFPREFDAEILNSIVVVLSIHNAPADIGDPNAYMPDDYTDQYKNYYRYGLLGAVQTINYLFTRNDFDKVNLGVMGVSQGGGLSICVAGLDDRVKLLVNSVPALCHHAGLHYDRTSGHPHYLFKSRTTFANDPSHENRALEATKYFDAAIFAKRFNGPSISFTSFEDEVCPPASVFIANNNLKEDKVIFIRRESGHDNPDYWQKRFEFIRNYMPSTRNPLINSPSNLGYASNIIHGNTTINLGDDLDLEAETYLDENLIDIPLTWDKVEGPGQAIFSSTKNKTTSVSFTEKGTYRLMFSAKDLSELGKSDMWVLINDYITITVQ